MQDESHATSVVAAVLRKLRPYRLVGAEKIRIGRFFDGGYVMLNRFEGIKGAYSLGINDDVSWDLDMACRGVDIFQYDHTIDKLPQAHPRFHWSKTGIGDGGADSAFERLEVLIDRNGHSEETDLILKCDIEGAEWGMLAQTPNQTLRQFRQIVMELHDLCNLRESHNVDFMRQCIDNLTASHRLVHIHANNYKPFDAVAGFALPRVVEVTLVRKDEGEFELSRETFPTALDMPCNPAVPDLYLGSFTFD